MILKRERSMRFFVAGRSLTAALLFFLAWDAAGGPLVAQDPPPVAARARGMLRPQQAAAQEGITVNFQNLDLGYVLTTLGQAAGINVVASNMPAIPVTVNNPVPLTVEQVRSLILSLAESYGVEVIRQEGALLLQGPIMQDGEVLIPRQLFIHRLRHSNALTLASTLQALFGGSMPIGTAARQPPQTLSLQLRTIEQQSAQAAQGIQTGGQQAVSFVTAPGELENAVQIVPDEITNSLLVRATANDWTIIQQAIESLDLRPLQVVIEVVIAEVSRTGDLNVGVGLFGTDVDEEGGEGSTGLLPVVPPADAFTLDVFRTGDIDVGVTLSALSSTGDVRILSRPLIQAQNNQEARILVGSERPFIQSSFSSVNTGGVAQEVVQYRDVGTSLTILPTINEDGYVNLLLTQEVSSATAETQFGAPIISTREATTQILARTGQTVVIGGLVDQQTEESRVGIPILKDIPVLGWLFGTTRKSVSNAELFLFLTPYVIADDEDEQRLRQELESNAELLQELLPIRSLLPPSIQALLPDSIVVDTIPPDTVQVDTMRVDTIPGRAVIIRPDTTRIGRN
jgi:type II secretory pathway component GspD/PulD (secretin)